MASTIQFTKVLFAAITSFTEICAITVSNTSALGVQLNVVESSSVDRTYRINVAHNATGAGVWRRLVPVDSTERDTTWGVDLQSNNNVVTLRIVRTVAGVFSQNSLKCKVRTQPSPGASVTIANATALGSRATNAGAYAGALLTKVDGKVGIGLEKPVHELDVVGNVNVSGTYKIGNVDVLSNTALGATVTTSNLSSVGTISTPLTVSGNVVLTGLTHNATTGNVVYINPTTGRLHSGTSTGGTSDVNVIGNLNVTGTTTLNTAVAVTGSTVLKTPISLLNLAENMTGNALYVTETVAPWASASVSYGAGLRNVAVTDPVSQNSVSVSGVTDLSVTGSAFLQGLSAPRILGNVFVVVDTTTGQLFRRPRPAYFTEQIFQATSTTQITTTSTTYQTALTLSNVPAGTYLVLVDATVNTNNALANVSVRMTLNGTPNATETVRTVQAFAEQERSVGLANYYVPTISSTITLQYASNNILYTVRMLRRTLYAIRIA